MGRAVFFLEHPVCFLSGNFVKDEAIERLVQTGGWKQSGNSIGKFGCDTLPNGPSRAFFRGDLDARVVGQVAL